MYDGFLQTRASLMLDLVFLAMFFVIPVMIWSIRLAKVHRRYALHRRVQLALALTLAVAVTLFEIDIRLYGWEHRAAPHGQIANAVWATLYVHLFFAITTVVLWVFVIVQALRHFDNPPVPCAYSRRHIFWARLAAIDMFMTAVTGWAFYVQAFVF